MKSSPMKKKKYEIINNIFKDMPSFVRMLIGGREQKIDFKFLGPREIKKIEPNISALGGIFIPEVSVINPLWVTSALHNGAKYLVLEI